MLGYVGTLHGVVLRLQDGPAIGLVTGPIGKPLQISRGMGGDRKGTEDPEVYPEEKKGNGIFYYPEIDPEWA